jgi:ABC-type multidrug transport system fused ATPase/permease subunit
MIWALFDTSERRFFWIVVGIVGLSAIGSVAMLLSIMPFLTVLSDPQRIHESRALSYAYELGGFDNDYDFLMALGAASVTVIVLANMLQLLKIQVIGRFVFMRAYSISTRLLEKYLRQHYIFFLDKHTGELGKQILSESQQVVDLAIRPAIDAFAALITVTFVVSALLYLEPVISLTAFGVIGMIYGSIIYFNRKMTERLGEVRKQANSDSFKYANEAMAGVKELMILGRGRYYLDLFSRPAMAKADSQRRIFQLTMSPQYVIHTIMFAGIIILCLTLMQRADFEGQTGLSEIIPTIGLLAFAGQRMLPELSLLFRSATMLSYAGPAVEAVYKDLVVNDTGEPLPRCAPTPLRLREVLTFESVSVRYPKTERPGLLEISFSIKAGERIGIVGSTGSGKTTLANTMLGLITPTEGRLLVDGRSVTPQTARAWQQAIGYVPQEIFLTDLSVRENIAFGLPKDEIDEDRVIEAARIARIHDFILQNLQDGYDTVVGERGSRLSGGQRQRIGIARALYNQVDLVLFDEATSALDNVTEKEVMRAVDALPGDKTLVMIAHRLATLKGCDRILVLREGKVVGFDTWVALERDCEEFRVIAQDAEP